MRCISLSVGLVLLGLLSSARSTASAAEGKALGKLVTPSGSLIRREAPGKSWQPVKEKEVLHAGELLLSIPLAVIETKNGLRLELLADMEGRSPFPIIESAAILNDNDKVDLDLTLDRGRVTISNPLDKIAKVRTTFHKETWDFDLKPGARLALETYGRWPKGSVFDRAKADKESPELDLVVLMLKGEAKLETECHHYRLDAPPGTAFFQWDSVTGCDARPTRMDKLPPWAESPNVSAEEIKRRLERVQRFRKVMLEQSLDAAIDEFLERDDPQARRAAVYLIAAMDDLPRLGKTIMTTKHIDVWENGVVALRHWLGRGPGQDLKLYNFLVDVRKHSPAHAETIVQLTRSFSDRDAGCPHCYEMLTDYLMHENQAIRGLAYWHLYRLVPEGRKINYNPLASKEEREKRFEEWKKLIPDGKLPPKPQTEKD